MLPPTECAVFCRDEHTVEEKFQRFSCDGSWVCSAGIWWLIRVQCPEYYTNIISKESLSHSLPSKPQHKAHATSRKMIVSESESESKSDDSSRSSDSGSDSSGSDSGSESGSRLHDDDDDEVNTKVNPFHFSMVPQTYPYSFDFKVSKRGLARRQEVCHSLVWCVLTPNVASLRNHNGRNLQASKILAGNVGLTCRRKAATMVGPFLRTTHLLKLDCFHSNSNQLFFSEYFREPYMRSSETQCSIKHTRMLETRPDTSGTLWRNVLTRKERKRLLDDARKTLNF